MERERSRFGYEVFGTGAGSALGIGALWWRFALSLRKSDAYERSRWP
jgi:hypothetical protein